MLSLAEHMKQLGTEFFKFGRCFIIVMLNLVGQLHTEVGKLVGVDSLIFNMPAQT